jgi:DNA cross-link repair 1C protein
MSTFDGFVKEFPDIRIDYFRTVPGREAPLACFLSHVHSDHLQGLESFKSPFIYCSAATRELLLRLEKYANRLNFAKGILESRKVQYRHLKNLLKAIPLNAPTDIELTPGQVIQVTLFDANHCAGAVMFLIDDGYKAILYTGDIRAEPWWVNSLAREPTLIPFISGIRRLETIYLDTTFATKEEVYRRFPTKAEGLKELLTKILSYPSDTIFHFNAWTFGYEGVWSFLASALNSQVHVDQYKWKLYNALAKSGTITQEGAALCGFQCGNRYQPGCLTNHEAVKLHTCERGFECDYLKTEKAKVVWITPIIGRTSEGKELPELGAGGGSGDLRPSLELDLREQNVTEELKRLCKETIDDVKERMRIFDLLSDALASGASTLRLEGMDSIEELDGMRLERLAAILQKNAAAKLSTHNSKKSKADTTTSSKSNGNITGSRTFTFPYSRHSSYEELYHLVSLFRPADIYPCVVGANTWDNSVSMKTLFGAVCSEEIFAHDRYMMERYEVREAGRTKKRSLQDSQETQMTDRLSDDDEYFESLPEQFSLRSKDDSSVQGLRSSKKARADYDGGRSTALSQNPKSSLGAPTSSPAASHEVRAQAIKSFFEERANHSSPSSSSKTIPRNGNSVKHTSQIESSSLPSTAKTHYKPISRNTSKLDTAKHLGSYQCCWSACYQHFPYLNTLRKHVLETHIMKGSSGESVTFSCKWRGCTRLERIQFESLDVWEEHMDCEHYYKVMDAFNDREGRLPALTGEGKKQAHLKTPDQARGTSTEIVGTPNECLRDPDSIAKSDLASHPLAKNGKKTPQISMSNRMVAYQAALRKDGWDWSTYSPFSSKDIGNKSDIEL